jgi:Protein of unknown function (DUF2793)
MPLQTDRLSLPLLSTAQAQKEMTHNEALALLDAVVQPVVVAVAPATLPASPAPGQAWIVGAGASGLWVGHDHSLAVWTSGGWRFVAPFEGMTVWSLADGMVVRRAGSVWAAGALTGNTLTLAGAKVVGAPGAAVANPTGGTTVDSEARAAVLSILSALRTHGLIAT